MATYQGRFGLVLRPDRITANKVQQIGALFSHGSAVVEPDQAHFTLYKSDGMEGVKIYSDLILGTAHLIASDIAKNGESTFELSNLRVHGGKYLLWRASVSATVQEAHKKTADLLSHFVSHEHKRRMVDWAIKQSPSIRKRDLELVNQYALQWVRWRNVPHLLCAFDPDELDKPAPRSKIEHRGVFTHLEFVRFGHNGHIEEICFSIPIVPVVVEVK